MVILPAIDLFEGNAVRLYKGDYNRMTVYSNDPVSFVGKFREAGATHLHLVDLEGARDGTTPNIDTITRIASDASLFVEVGGGIRNMETAKRYMDAGVDRVIIGTAAVSDPEFLKEAVASFGPKVAVGVDVLDGKVAVRGWTEKSEFDTFTFCEFLSGAGVTTVICTDISKDGTLEGTNLSLYEELNSRFGFDVVASGGVSSLADLSSLAKAGIYGAIVGKAYYTGSINLKEAIEVAKQ